MIGAYDFCGHYEWTFAWLEERGGKALLHRYWDEAIHQDSQRHAADLILRRGIDGMKEYWGHSLSQEVAGYSTTATEKLFRIDIHDCPSKGFLLRNKIEGYRDYCDHCIGWIGPMLKRAGFVIDHQHNHGGQCWWEMRRANQAAPALPHEPVAHDVRLRQDWDSADHPIDSFLKANGPADKI